MSTPDFSALVSRHRNYFRSGATRPVEWREGQLTALRAMMTDHAEDFYAALGSDLRRNRTDEDLTDVKYLAGEAEHVLAHLREWLKPVPVSTPTLLEPSDVRVRKGQLLLAVSPQASQAWGDNPGCPARAVRPAPPAAHAPPRGPAS